MEDNRRSLSPIMDVNRSINNMAITRQDSSQLDISLPRIINRGERNNTEIK